MRIISLFNNNIQNYKIIKRDFKQNATSPLASPEDTLSFRAMKKKEFEGIDAVVIEKYKAPINQFNSNNDLQNWAKSKVDEIINQDYGGRQKETQIQRKAILKEWADYVVNENDAYNNAAAILILTSITKELEPNNDKLPPVLNKGVLADCIYDIKNNLKANKKYQFDFNKMYETKLTNFYLEDTDTGESETKWIVIPSKEHDPENFSDNVDKLKALSHKNWCTKSFNAQPYLENGDFHVYLENGKPKIGIRFVGDSVCEIQGEQNNKKIPVKYLDEVKEHIDNNRLQLDYSANKQIANAEKLKCQIDKIKNDLQDAIDNDDVKTIFEYFQMRPETDEDGFLSILHYRADFGDYTFSDLGIDENWLFKKVKRIKTNADFKHSQVTNLGSLESIGWNANFGHSLIKDLGNLKSIGQSAFFEHSQVTNLGSLESIGRFAHVPYYRLSQRSLSEEDLEELVTRLEPITKGGVARGF